MHATDFTQPFKADLAYLGYQILPFLGRLETGAVALLPHAKASTTTSYLDYDFFTFTTPKTPVTLTLYFTLTLDIDPTNPLSYEVIIDDYSYGFHRLMEDPERAGLLPQGWNQAMQDCVWTKVIIVCGSTDTNDGREGTLPLLKLGKHRLKYRAWQENVVLEKMVLDLGGVRESYLGPEESEIVGNKE